MSEQTKLPEVLAARAAEEVFASGLSSAPWLHPAAREYFGTLGYLLCEQLQRVAASSLNDESREDDAYYLYLAAEFMHSIAKAAMKKVESNELH